ncbi:hypothetical protein ABMA28_002643 [Loxostege sticticalis]|uniref:Uncharacterized protein n=1 Tax=Loxostege sticticalis TaxID=481309 RepID=A0ABD0SXI1_LOXSC
MLTLYNVLLQLCRAEISEIVPGTWFSANAINDGYSPKPLSEIFSTEPSPPFSPTKPIVVLPSFSSLQQEPEVTYLSTSTPKVYPSSTPLPPSTTQYSTTYNQYEQSSTPYPQTSSSFPPSSTPFPPLSSTYPPTSYQSTVSTFLPSSVTTPAPTSNEFFDFSQTPRPLSELPQQPETTREGKSTLGHAQSVTFGLPQSIPTLPPSLFLPQTQTTAPPNYFVIYQNAPQSIQSYPQQQSSELTQAPLLVTSPLTVTTSLPPSSTVTLSDGTISPYITNALSDGTSRPTVTFRSTPPAFTVRNPPCTPSPRPYLRNVTQSSLKVHPGPPKVPFMPNLKIRVVAPKGSITNVKINPTTTPKPHTTRRTKKPKKNTYDGCLDSCKGRKDPLCAIPLASVTIDPKSLKGFNSICHMACHNSYKPDPYEKLVDGRCGRLRTRIIRVDGNHKIHREELKKSEYSVINTGPKTVVEFAHGSHPK